MNNKSEKNPLFLPALISALFPVVFFILFISGIYIDGLMDLLLFLTIIAPFASIYFSVAGLIDAKKHQEPFIGCVFCIFLVFLEVLLILQSYLSRPPSHPEVTIAPHSHTYEETDNTLSFKPATENKQKKNP